MTGRPILFPKPRHSPFFLLLHPNTSITLLDAPLLPCLEWENVVIWARDKQWRRSVRSETWRRGKQKIKITVKHSHFRMAESHCVITHLIRVAHAHTAWDCITEIVGKQEYNHWSVMNHTVPLHKRRTWYRPTLKIACAASQHQLSNE